MSETTPAPRVVVGRDQFLKPLPRTTEDVAVPEFGEGCVIPVCSMYTNERNEYEAYFTLANGKANMSKLRNVRQSLVVACCRDDAGQPLFTLADIAAIATQHSVVVERLVEAAMRLNHMKSDVEKLEKNSEATDAA